MATEGVESEIFVPNRVCLKAKSLHAAGFANFQDWNFYDHNLYIGRYNKFTGASSSKWMNPYNLQDYEIGDSLLLYEWKIRNNMVLLNALTELEAKYLGCYCQTYSPCHGQILVTLFNAPNWGLYNSL